VQLLPVTEVEVKAEIARPSLHEIIPAETIYRVYGAAWTGESDITKVEVSTDGGIHWENAQLLGDSVPYAWRFWEYYWRTPASPGHICSWLEPRTRAETCNPCNVMPIADRI